MLAFCPAPCKILWHKFGVVQVCQVFSYETLQDMWLLLFAKGKLCHSQTCTEPDGHVCLESLVRQCMLGLKERMGNLPPQFLQHMGTFAANLGTTLPDHGVTMICCLASCRERTLQSLAWLCARLFCTQPKYGRFLFFVFPGNFSPGCTSKIISLLKWALILNVAPHHATGNKAKISYGLPTKHFSPGKDHYNWRTQCIPSIRYSALCHDCQKRW